MKKVLFALLIIALVVLPLAGCGGGGAANEQAPAQTTDQSGSTTTDPATTTTTPSTPATPVTPAATTPSKQLPRKPEFSGKIPSDFKEALDGSWIIVVAFYNPDDHITSSKFQDVVEDVVESPSYKDQISYISYEVNDKTSPAVASLATSLGVGYAPQVTILDRDGDIVFEENGFTESEHLTNALYNEVYINKD